MKKKKSVCEPSIKRRKKVYCSECQRYAFSPYIICNLPVPQDTYFKHYEVTQVMPNEQNKNNDCVYYLPKKEVEGE